jgi:hypothetical protein
MVVLQRSIREAICLAALAGLLVSPLVALNGRAFLFCFFVIFFLVMSLVLLKKHVIKISYFSDRKVFSFQISCLFKSKDYELFSKDIAYCFFKKHVGRGVKSECIRIRIGELGVFDIDNGNPLYKLSTIINLLDFLKSQNVAEDLRLNK